MGIPHLHRGVGGGPGNRFFQTDDEVEVDDDDSDDEVDTAGLPVTAVDAAAPLDVAGAAAAAERQEEDAAILLVILFNILPLLLTADAAAASTSTSDCEESISTTSVAELEGTVAGFDRFTPKSNMVGALVRFLNVVALDAGGAGFAALAPPPPL